MRIETLLTPGILQSGHRLRTESAKAISAAEIFMDATGKQKLTDFFADCATKAGGTVTPVIPATSAIVANGDTALPIKNSVGASVGTGTATVAANVITGIALPATKAVLSNTDANIVVQNSAGAAITSAGVAAVAAGVLSNVKLPSTIAAVTSTVKVVMPAATGTYVNGYTFTVVNGVITAAVAS